MQALRAGRDQACRPRGGPRGRSAAARAGADASQTVRSLLAAGELRRVWNFARTLTRTLTLTLSVQKDSSKLCLGTLARPGRRLQSQYQPNDTIAGGGGAKAAKAGAGAVSLLRSVENSPASDIDIRCTWCSQVAQLLRWSRASVRPWSRVSLGRSTSAGGRMR